MPSSDVLDLKHGRAADTSCRIHLFGAQISSWIVDGAENIFVSTKSALDGSKPIRGGIPICFPAFGAWERGPQHGFARMSGNWKVEAEPVTDEGTGDVSLVLSLEDDEESRKMWNHKFLFLYTVILRRRELVMDVDVKNKGPEDFDFTFALHTYFKVPDVGRCSVSNLKGLSYDDKTQGGKEEMEESDRVVISGFTDRVYKASPGVCELVGLEGNRVIQLRKTNIADTVVWNPWVEGAAKMADMDDQEYKIMVCVEAVQHSRPAIVTADQHWIANHTLAVKE